MIELKRWKAGALLLLCVLFFNACDSNRVFEENKAIPEHGWTAAEKAVFEVPVSDTLSYCNLYVNIRNTGKYPYRNLFLFLEIESPEGNVQQDTIECILADQRGKWLGSGFGDVFDNRVLFKRNIIFPDSGKYVFRFEQAMRAESLSEIKDVGLRIEKAKG